MTISPGIEAIVAVALLAVLGAVAVSSFVLGLWFGERGRRMDAQRREGVLRVGEPERAQVIAPGGLSNAEQSEELQPPSRFIRETMAETGCSEAEARAEWYRLMNTAMGDSSQGWVQD